mgnify:FL=1
MYVHDPPTHLQLVLNLTFVRVRGAQCFYHVYSIASSRYEPEDYQYDPLAVPAEPLAAERARLLARYEQQLKGMMVDDCTAVAIGALTR